LWDISLADACSTAAENFLITEDNDERDFSVENQITCIAKTSLPSGEVLAYNLKNIFS